MERDVVLVLREGICEHGDKCKIMCARSCTCAWAADEVERLRGGLQKILQLDGWGHAQVIAMQALNAKHT